jgi:hypothetical protein
VARTGDGRGTYRVFMVKPGGGGDHLQDLSVDGRTVVNCILKKSMSGGRGLD